ncbi:Probable sensor histidine kinase [gamma proteobacterium HdN1]|nr:Probable sensor histidine kinase [gamma proteobacterium HdN1]
MNPAEHATASFGRHEGTVWIRATLQHLRTQEIDTQGTDSQKPLFLEISYPHLKDIKLYWAQNSKIIQTRHGGYSQTSSRDLPCQGFCFRIPQVQEDLPLTLYIAVQSNSPIIVPLRIFDEATLLRHTRISHIVLGIFYGSFVVMFFYNLFIYSSTRAREYLLYDLYLITLCLWVASHDGTLRDLVLPNFSWSYSYHFHVLLTLLGAIAGGYFSKSFLDTRTHAPRLNALFSVLLSFGMICVLWVLAAKNEFPTGIANLLTVALSATAIISGIVELRRGVSMARYFLVGWISVVTGSTLWVLTLSGILPYIHGAMLYVHIGCLLETVLLSLALADRINQLQAERARLQQQAKALLEDTNRKLALSNRFKDEFLSTISHELRTPMNGIIGSSELLKMTHLDDEQNNYLHQIARSSQGMMRMVEDILAYTQLNTDRHSFEQKPVNITRLFEELCSHFRARSQAQRLSFSSHFSPDLPRFVRGDAGKIDMILRHLLDNACKFTENGGIRFSATKIAPLAKDPQGAIWIRFSISDTGHGVPKELHESVFEMFRQVDASMTRKQGGLGIGLALCKQIVVRMRGKLEFLSDVNHGTDVHVYLPFQPVTAQELESIPSILPSALFQTSHPRNPIQESHASQEKRAKQGVEPASENAHQSDDSLTNNALAPLSINTSTPAAAVTEQPIEAPQARILIVEDNQVNYLVLEGILRKLGHIPIAANNGKEALSILKAITPDLIFMDLQMPVMDGFEATEAIRKLPPPKGNLPIVAVTANSDADNRERCTKCGMNGVIGKPFTRKDIKNALDLWLAPASANTDELKPEPPPQNGPHP